MPQLRDSGSQPSAAGHYGHYKAQSSSPRTSLPAVALHDAAGHESAEFDSYDRIFGIETEYGVSVTGAEHPCDAAHAAMSMFEPLLARSRSTNMYMANGSRLYLDVGSHPEYATAEARDPHDALIQDLAGERMMAKLAHDAQSRLREQCGPATTVHVFKNNVDSQEHSFGCHENYLVRRFVSLPMLEQQLVPMLVTRQIFTGAGRVAPHDGFSLSQRADFLDDAVSSATTHSRPMINTRDEPHADSREYRRLHVILGDSNRSRFATLMKLTTTHLVLCVIEDAARRGVASGLECCALKDPNTPNRIISAGSPRSHLQQDTLPRLSSPNALPAGIHAPLNLVDPGGLAQQLGTTGSTAIDVQRHYLAVVKDFVAAHRDAIDHSLPHTNVADILREWASLLDELASGHADALIDRVDWVAKYRLLEGLQRRSPHIDRSALVRLAFDYHDVAHGRTYEGLLARGVMRRIVDDGDIDHALTSPPADTRARLRGMFIARALRQHTQFSCDWTHLALTTAVRREIVLLDPFDSQDHGQMDALFAQ